MLEKRLSEKLRFASEEDLETILGIKTGAVSPFALISDKEQRVTLIIDREVYESSIVSFHPCVNTETLQLSRADFHKYLESLGRKPIIT